MLIATKAVHAQGSRAIPAPRDAKDLEEVKLPTGPSFNRKDASHKAPKTRFVQGVSKAKLAKAYRAELQSLQSVDDLVEAVVDALKKAGKLDDTLIV